MVCPNLETTQKEIRISSPSRFEIPIPQAFPMTQQSSRNDDLIQENEFENFTKERERTRETRESAKRILFFNTLALSLSLSALYKYTGSLDKFLKHDKNVNAFSLRPLLPVQPLLTPLVN